MPLPRIYLQELPILLLKPILAWRDGTCHKSQHSRVKEYEFKASLNYTARSHYKTDNVPRNGISDKTENF